MYLFIKFFLAFWPLCDSIVFTCYRVHSKRYSMPICRSPSKPHKSRQEQAGSDVTFTGTSRFDARFARLVSHSVLSSYVLTRRLSLHYCSSTDRASQPSNASKRRARLQQTAAVMSTALESYINRILG